KGGGAGDDGAAQQQLQAERALPQAGAHHDLPRHSGDNSLAGTSSTPAGSGATVMAGAASCSLHTHAIVAPLRAASNAGRSTSARRAPSGSFASPPPRALG